MEFKAEETLSRRLSNASGSSSSAGHTALCSSCDRCRARKTRCDGKRPCGNCAARYKKRKKLDSIEGIPLCEFDCVYSPAKRRGPVPGRSSQLRRLSKAEESDSPSKSSFNGNSSNQPSSEACRKIPGIHPSITASDVPTGLAGGSPLFAAKSGILRQLENQKQQLSAILMKNDPFSSKEKGFGNDPVALMVQQQRQMMLQSHLRGFNLGGIRVIGDSGIGLLPTSGTINGSSGNGGLYSTNAVGNKIGDQQANTLFQAQQQQIKENQVVETTSSNSTQKKKYQASESSLIEHKPRRRRLSGGMTKLQPKYITNYASLLRLNDADGNLLRSYFSMSINEIFCLPPIPTDEEYCIKRTTQIDPAHLPRSEAASLQAARFAEIALGAQVNNQMSLAFQLSNATVICLQECMETIVHPSSLYYVARAFFLHGVLRSLKGDFHRYFKYRRICLTHLSQLNSNPGVEYLLAAISFQDSWAYMFFNGRENDIPDSVKDFLPLENCHNVSSSNKYGISCDPASIATNPTNNMWIQGVPPVYINDDAPPLCRSLDALSCALRAYCDQANTYFANLSDDSDRNSIKEDAQNESYSIDACKDEFGSRNMLISAHTLLQAHEATSKSAKNNYGHNLIISALDAFLQNDDEWRVSFTDSQIKSILSVCNSTIERPLLLHLGGPTYHVICNSTILLSHVLNTMHANLNKDNKSSRESEQALFKEILDTFCSIRKLLNIHRRKLPAHLRCHSIPPPNFSSQQENGKKAPLVDLGETLMCKCRQCQRFVVMGCSRALASNMINIAQINSGFASARESSETVENNRDNTTEPKEASELDDKLLNFCAEVNL